ncbi:hypothetical protein EF847_17920 [Actinobacteria bacterium YIM 96077]|uniref:Putative zinc-finger domain-containing protein n=1 Tax=Phytoactinopolyspora halophila TaxID=1981511 RepID=A0A329QVU5_9ACTN|nr:zf-HC2 domain-containing protein [Phytoactinopolyspora halophila]AYY14296.1 hypothetical protein EF847_17920 [Actinobacteria bacterium YIM 96077]RAW14838.1 hypothetical protein DPM12_10135 [Phytoactinopolyspora halophila]
MKHLDERVSDLIDDRLDHDERDRALAHLASCESCREAVEMERFAKGVLRSLPGVDVPASLTDKLMALAEPAGPLPPDESSTDHADVAAWNVEAPSTSSVWAATGYGGTPHQTGSGRLFVDRHRRGLRVAAVGMASTGALLVVLATLGAPSNTGGDQPPGVVVPPMEQFTVEHARSTGGLPFAEPASVLVPTLGSDERGGGSPVGSQESGRGVGAADVAGSIVDAPASPSTGIAGE